MASYKHTIRSVYKSWGGAPRREELKSREKHTGKGEGMSSGLEGKEIVCPKWGWDKRKIPGGDQK